ncbi:MAG: hypothetical protein JWO96_211 [Candidatus Saccharibacteria bacterium]|nr:hypothetical protein [Candidatus Saccharibacteria bacterium]
MLAVSGGVDSMVLLDILAKTEGVDLVVAHFDHGIRADSYKDAEFAAAAAKRYGLPFEMGRDTLGQNASEEKARQARYKFLYEAAGRHGADMIITAHHQDDAIETAIINLLRGTGARGLIAIGGNPRVMRPLLGIPKQDILAYASAHSLEWREDATNSEDKYLRNRIRGNVVAKMTQEQRHEFLEHIRTIEGSSAEASMLIDGLLDSILLDESTVDRAAFSNLPAEVSAQLLMKWLRTQGVKDLDRPTVERLAMAIKTAAPGTRHNVKKEGRLDLSINNAHFSNTLANA